MYEDGCEREGLAGNCGIDCPMKFCEGCSYFETIESQPWSKVRAGRNFECFGCRGIVPRGHIYWGQPDGVEFCVECYLEYVPGVIRYRYSGMRLSDPGEVFTGGPVKSIDAAVFDPKVKVFQELFQDLASIPGEEQKSQVQLKVTKSFTLEFPNGEVVEVPGPDGEGWTSEVVKYDWPIKYCQEMWTQLQTYDVKHDKGKLIFEEYAVRAKLENARVVSITKWTRDPSYTLPVEEETFEQRAIRKYPSRLRD